MSRFDDAGGPAIPYSDKHPERCQPAPGPAFVLPGDDEARVAYEAQLADLPEEQREAYCASNFPDGAARQCGDDPAMPPAGGQPHWRRDVNIGYAHLKGRS